MSVLFSTWFQVENERTARGDYMKPCSSVIFISIMSKNIYRSDIILLPK